MKLRYSILFSALFAIALLAPQKAHAQYNIQIALNGGTNNVSATTTNTSFAVTIPVTRAEHVALQPSFKLTGSGSSSVVFKFDSSVDGSVWESATHSVTVAASGTSVVTKVANQNVNAIGYLRLTTVENPNSAAITNLTLKAGTKRLQ